MPKPRPDALSLVASSIHRTTAQQPKVVFNPDLELTMADEEKEERLKAALWYSLGTFVDEECLNQNLNATPEFIGALTQLVYNQISNTSRDLETFAKHARRKVINEDDVMLLSRRNEGLETVLKKYLEEMKAKEGRGAGAAAEPKKRGRPSGTGIGKGKGKAKQ